MATGASRKTGRRAEYAAATCRAIDDAARELFSTKGYIATTVDDIAEAARVAPATVYVVAGGKQGLLRSIIEETYARILGMTDADELLRFITHATRVRFENARGLMRVVIDTAPHDAIAAQALETVHASLRGGLNRAARRLSELDSLRDGIDVRQATDTLWFYLGNNAYFTLTDDNEWSLDKAEQWLHESLRTALLR